MEGEGERLLACLVDRGDDNSDGNEADKSDKLSNVNDGIVSGSSLHGSTKPQTFGNFLLDNFHDSLGTRHAVR